jgi:hypothetical protein
MGCGVRDAGWYCTSLHRGWRRIEGRRMKTGSGVFNAFAVFLG